MRRSRKREPRCVGHDATHARPHLQLPPTSLRVPNAVAFPLLPRLLLSPINCPSRMYPGATTVPQARAAAAAVASQPDPAPVQAAERQARGRLLAAQRRLSEALRLKAALMAHLAEVQAAAAAAPRYQAQRQALRVGEAQQQVVEAAKVVALAESEVGW